jgi:hypothetical protein
MAAETRNVSGGKGWSNGDIFQLVALLIGIPAAIVGFIVLAAYYRRRRQRRRGKTLFPRGDRVQRPLGAYSASQTQGISHHHRVTHVVLRRRGPVMRLLGPRPALVVGDCILLPAVAIPSCVWGLLTHGWERRREVVVWVD